MMCSSICIDLRRTCTASEAQRYSGPRPSKDATRRGSEIHRNKLRMMKCSVNWQVWRFEAETWTVVQEIHNENAPLDLEGRGLNECRLFQTVLTTNQSPNQGSKREHFGNPCYQSESKGLWSRASGLPGTSGSAFYQNDNQRPGWVIALSPFLTHVPFAKSASFSDEASSQTVHHQWPF